MGSTLCLDQVARLKCVRADNADSAQRSDVLAGVEDLINAVLGLSQLACDRTTCNDEIDGDHACDSYRMGSTQAFWSLERRISNRK